MFHVNTWGQIGLGIQIFLFQNVVFTRDVPSPEGLKAALRNHPKEYFFGERYQ